ncbi:MAG: lipoate--protein ligase [Planctomycetes bacterium]|nr:lipoate--protein ligase [Planctomycetota bacterium]
MNRNLHIFRDPPLDGPTNMARDEHLLRSDRFRPAAARIYAWSPPTLSLGYFQRYSQRDELPAEVRRLAVVRRLTGGGAILHDCEVTYSLVLDDTVSAARESPATLYRLAHDCWRDAIAAAGGPAGSLASEDFPLPSPRTGPFFCFEKPGRTDLLLGTAKVLGSAQRRIPGRVMQHGSLILHRRYTAHPGADLGNPPPQAVGRWVDGFLTLLAERLGLSGVPASWDEDALAEVERLRGRYLDDAHTRRR